MAGTERSARDLVVEFYDTALNQKNVDKARAFLGDSYTQHNPAIANGPDAFLRFVRFLIEQFPHAHNEIKMVVAEGALVALYVHSVRVPGTRGRRIVDIFRVNGGKVVEHWDVIQDIPEAMYPPINDNGLF